MDGPPPPYSSEQKLSGWALIIPFLVLLNVILFLLRIIIFVVQLLLTSFLVAFEITIKHLSDIQKSVSACILSALHPE